MPDGSTTGSRKRWIWLGILGLGGVLLVAAGAGAVFWLAGSGGVGPVAELVQGPLPSEVRQLNQVRALNRHARFETPAALDRSFLAGTLCGGEDVAEQLLEAKDQQLSELGSDTLDLLAGEDVVPAMKCAAKAYGQMDEPALMTLKFEDSDEEDRQVVLFPARFDDLPLKKHSFRGLDGYCEKDEDSGDCDEDEVALVRREGLWASGKFPAVDELAREWTSERETATTDVEIARNLVAELGDAQQVSIWIKPDEVSFSDACVEAAPTKKIIPFVTNCWPDDVGDTLKSIVAETRGHAVEKDFPGRGGTFRVAHTLLARDERGAEDIERDLRDLIRDWKAQLENQKTDLIELVRELEDDDERDAREAIVRAFLRGAGEMEAERSGRIVRLVIEQELREEELRAVDAGLGPRPEDLQVISRIVKALESGKKPAQKDLAHFVGLEAAEWMLLPRADASDCKAIRAHFDGLDKKGVAAEQFGAKFRLKGWLEGDDCAGHPLPPERKKCLLGAEDMEAMDACDELPTPSEAWARKLLRGQWRITKVTTDDGDKDFVDTFQDSRMEFGDGRVAWAGQGVKAASAHDARGVAEDRVAFRWPLADDPPLIEAEVTGRDELHIKSEDGSFGLVLERSDFDESLLDGESAQ